MTKPDQASNKGFGILKFFTNPYIGIIGSIASIIGIFIAVYFYSIGKRYRELVYFVHPAKAIVVKTGQSSKLQFYFDGKEIKSDVTAAQIAIWNQGTESIKKDNILSSINIATKPQVQILETSTVKKSRDIIQLSFDQFSSPSGIIPLTWNILEKGDGVILQIIYAGDTNVNIALNGAIEGQEHPKEIQYSGSILSATEQFASQKRQFYIITGAILFTLILYIIMLIVLKRKSYKINSMEYYLGGIIILSLIVMLIYTLLNQIPEPPFGF